MFKRALLLSVLFAAPAFAQDAPAADPAPLIEAARTAYAAGDIGGARRALEQANASMAHLQGKAVRAALPSPLTGWELEEADVVNVGLATLGGGVSLSNVYRHDADGEVVIEALVDSTIVEQMTAVMFDPAVVQANGAKIETIAGEQAVVEGDGQRILFIVDKRSSLTVSGGNAGAVRAYAEKIDFAAFRAAD